MRSGEGIQLYESEHPCLARRIKCALGIMIDRGRSQVAVAGIRIQPDLYFSPPLPEKFSSHPPTKTKVKQIILYLISTGNTSNLASLQNFCLQLIYNAFLLKNTLSTLSVKGV